MSKVGYTPTGWNFWAHGFGIEPFEGPASVMAPWVAGLALGGVKDPKIDDLAAAWRLQQDLTQILKIALAEGHEPETEPRALRALLAKAAGVQGHRALRARLTAARQRAHAAGRGAHRRI